MQTSSVGAIAGFRPRSDMTDVGLNKDDFGVAGMCGRKHTET